MMNCVAAHREYSQFIKLTNKLKFEILLISTNLVLASKDWKVYNKRNTRRIYAGNLARWAMAKDMMSVQQAAIKWELSVRRVQTLCSQGRVEGAEVFGKSWMLPADTPRPVDGRSKAAREVQENDHPMPRKSPNLSMTDLYHTPGGAAKASKALQGNPPARRRFDAGIAYSRGEIETVHDYAKFFLVNHTGFYAVLGAGMLLSFCAIWQGNLELWQEAKRLISKAPCRTETERAALQLVLTAANSSVFGHSDFPRWFERGSFELLHPDTHPTAKVFYAKYLYMAAYALASRQITLEGVQGLALMRMISNTIEPMIAQAVVDRTVIPEIHLRLWCAIAYHNSGQDELAIPHIDKAITLALPDRLLGILAEHWRQLDNLLDDRLSLVDTAAAKQTRELHRTFAAGQAVLSGKLRNRSIASNLSTREREVAKLISFGFTNRQVAKTTGISETTVKTVVKNIMQKTGLGSREDFVFIL